MRSRSSPQGRTAGYAPGTSSGTAAPESPRESFRDVRSGCLLYGLVFFLGYLLANILSAWEHQRFVESVLASNGFVAVLRLGLADELDGLRGDLAGMVRPLEAIGSKTREAGGTARRDPHATGQTAARRTAAIKAQYGNTSAEDDLLKRMLRDRLVNRAVDCRRISAPQHRSRRTREPGRPGPPRSRRRPSVDGKARRWQARPGEQ